jgi:hypothetical protein
LRKNKHEPIKLIQFQFNGPLPEGSPEIFPFETNEAHFVTDDVNYVYSRILTDVIERTEGLSADELNLLSDNCVASERSDGGDQPSFESDDSSK